MIIHLPNWEMEDEKIEMDEMQHTEGQEVGAALQKLGNQDLEAQKCWYNTDSQPTAHTFMFRAP
jgi:hypothetical protein